MSYTTLFSKLSHKLITISVQPESGKIPTTEHFSNKNRVRAFPTITPAIQAELQDINQQGCAIYFTINQGDGLPEIGSDNLNCGKRANIITLNTLCIDTDDGDYLQLQEVLSNKNLLPHITVSSSPGKYHLYFLIQTVEAKGDNVLKWQALQKFLQTLVPGLDKSTSDINQVLRVPDYYNHKRDIPHLVAITHISDHPIYDLHTLFTIHANQDLEEFKSSYNKFEFPKGKLSFGERRTYITRYIEHIMENVLPLDAKEEDVFVLVDAFIIKYCTETDTKDFLEGGIRRQNIVQYYLDQKNYRLKKHSRMRAAIESTELELADAVADEFLPDSFYDLFPGPVGDVCRSYSAYAPKLPRELAFASALFTVGLLKADTYRFKGSWPLLNGFILAGPGVGKSLVKGLCEQFLRQVGYEGPYNQLLSFQNTVQSLHTDLYRAGGVGAVMVDESGDYLKTITAHNSPGYAKALRKYFKESTTGAWDGPRLSPGKSMSFTLPDIEHGMLSLWMCIQPSLFRQVFTSADFADGFLARFLVFNGRSSISLTEEMTSRPYSLSTELRVLAQALQSQYSPASAVASVVQAAKEELLARNSKAKPADIAMAQAEAVYRVRSENRLLSYKIEVELDTGAIELMQDFLGEIQSRARAIQQVDEEASELSLYIRVREMLSRLVCCCAPVDGRVSEEFMFSVIKFYRYCLQKMITKQLPSIEVDEDSETTDEVVKAVKRAIKAVGGPVLRDEIKNALPGRVKRGLRLGQRLEALVRSQELLRTEGTNTRGKSTKLYYLP